MATEVGIRELKANLSAFVDRIEQGEVITVTKHGKPVARIVPPGISAGLAELIADEAVQIHGGYGYMREYDVERGLRDARLGPIGGGTSEIMKEIIGKTLGL